MTDLRFFCTVCGQNLVASSAMGGAVIECPKCREKATVPALTDAEGQTLFAPTKILTIEVKFLCLSCFTELCVDTVWEGRIMLCPTCGMSIQVPDITCELQVKRDDSHGGFYRPGSLRQPANIQLSPEEIEFLSAGSDSQHS